MHNYDGVVMDITWKTAYIWDIYVVQKYRNRGIGTALLENTMAYLRSIELKRSASLLIIGTRMPRDFLKSSGLGFESLLGEKSPKAARARVQKP